MYQPSSRAGQFESAGESYSAAGDAIRGWAGPLLGPGEPGPYYGGRFSTTIPRMSSRHILRLCFVAGTFLFCCAASAFAQAAQAGPAASGARMLLLPKRVVSGERATLAVLDVNGRLTPGVAVNFSNGDRFTTDVTGRALFVAPLNPGVLFASIAGRSGRVPIVVLSPAEVAASVMRVDSAPRIASITDRIEMQGAGFCGDADANQVSMNGQHSLVLASSPTSLTVLPPAEAGPGAASVEISCAKRSVVPFSVTLVELVLEADSSSLKPGEHRALIVRVRGTAAKVSLEARNLAPEAAELVGGNTVRATSSGGAENSARFEVVGRKSGSFLISMKLVYSPAKPLP